jgi:hypothetical protein
MYRMQSGMKERRSRDVDDQALSYRRFPLDCGKTSETSMFSKRAGQLFGELLIEA